MHNSNQKIKIKKIKKNRFIKSLQGNSIALDVSNIDSVFSVKQQIEAREGIFNAPNVFFFAVIIWRGMQKP